MGQARTAIRSAGAVIGGVLLIVVTAVAAHADSHRWLKYRTSRLQRPPRALRMREPRRGTERVPSLGFA